MFEPSSSSNGETRSFSTRKRRSITGTVRQSGSVKSRYPPPFSTARHLASFLARGFPRLRKVQNPFSVVGIFNSCVFPVYFCGLQFAAYSAIFFVLRSFSRSWAASRSKSSIEASPHFSSVNLCWRLAI